MALECYHSNRWGSYLSGNSFIQLLKQHLSEKFGDVTILLHHWTTNSRSLMVYDLLDCRTKMFVSKRVNTQTSEPFVSLCISLAYLHASHPHINFLTSSDYFKTLHLNKSF